MNLKNKAFFLAALISVSTIAPSLQALTLGDYARNGVNTTSNFLANSWNKSVELAKAGAYNVRDGAGYALTATRNSFSEGTEFAKANPKGAAAIIVAAAAVTGLAVLAFNKLFGGHKATINVS